MATAEKISIALPAEMVAIIRGAVATGEYASSSEVVRDVLRAWTHRRSLRERGLDELRQAWREALEDTSPGVPADGVLDRLEGKKVRVERVVFGGRNLPDLYEAG